MSKQSSVEWIIEKYTIVLGLGSKELMKEHIERARVMHEREVKDAYIKSSFIDETRNPEQYYKDTFA